MSFVQCLATVVVEATNQHGVRSSRRTDKIHECIKTHIETRNPRVRCIVEYRLSTRLGDFDVDIAVQDRTTGALVACLLFKGLTSSIAKNEKNYEHNKFGEAHKAKSGMGSAKLVFLDVVPIRCPTYKSDGTIMRWETHNPVSVRERASTVTALANDGRVVPLIDDIYTVFVDYEFPTSKTIGLKSVVDATDLTRFEALLDQLAPV
jgi:hypothetical protein